MLVLTRDVYDAILDHATEAVPREACGVLAGSRGTSDRPAVATTAHQTANAAETPTLRYSIDPEELLGVVETVEQAGREVVGFYHSHPAGPTSPSDTDHREATWADHHYIIASLAGRPPTLDAWVWTGERFARDAVTISSGDGGGAGHTPRTGDAAGTRRD